MGGRDLYWSLLELERIVRIIIIFIFDVLKQLLFVVTHVYVLLDIKPTMAFLDQTQQTNPRCPHGATLVGICDSFIKNSTHFIQLN